MTRERICLELDPFNDAECDFTATHLMTVAGAGAPHDVEDRPVCDRHLAICEAYFRKYYPNARVTKTRIGA